MSVGGSLDDACDRPGPMRAGEELNRATLEPFLRSHFPAEHGYIEFQQYPSGHSNLTYSVKFGSREMVLRRPPFGSKVKSAHDMSREYRVLSKLHAAYPPAPEVLLYCEDESIIGAPFYLMEPVHGIIIRRDPPASLDFSADTARRLSEAFVANLAELHRLDYNAIGLGALGNPEGYLDRQVNGWTERYHRSKTYEHPGVERLVEWMTARKPSSRRPALIHNDYKFDNVVLDTHDPTRIIGLLDWEMCTIGDPLTDLGTLLAYWVEETDPAELKAVRWGPTNFPGSLRRIEIVQLYRELTKRDTSEITFYLVFARFKLAVIVQQIYYRYHHGLTKDQRFASMHELVRILLQAALRCAATNKI
ncbi:MAG: phosphotransferase family protein [Candidatus Acidiferrales bacterium]|jgi:aminoglycoside phosphotransferase (APT) family kinase protein